MSGNKTGGRTKLLREISNQDVFFSGYMFTTLYLPAEDGTETHILCVTCEVSPEHFMLLLAIIFVMGWGLRYSKVKWPVVKLF